MTSGSKLSSDEAIKGAPGWFVTSKPCAICGGRIPWHFQKGERDLNEPKQNACLDCDQDGWGYAT